MFVENNAYSFICQYFNFPYLSYGSENVSSHETEWCTWLQVYSTSWIYLIVHLNPSHSKNGSNLKKRNKVYISFRKDKVKESWKHFFDWSTAPTMRISIGHAITQSVYLWLENGSIIKSHHRFINWWLLFWTWNKIFFWKTYRRMTVKSYCMGSAASWRVQ